MMETRNDRKEINELLDMNLLLSRQELNFGINMFDSLTEDDDPYVDQFIAIGLSTNEAILKVFESKYGKLPPPQVNNPFSCPTNSSIVANFRILFRVFIVISIQR